MDHRINNALERIEEQVAQIRQIIQESNLPKPGAVVVAPDILELGQVKPAAKKETTDEDNDPEIPTDKICAVITVDYDGSARTTDVHVFDGDVNDPRQLVNFVNQMDVKVFDLSAVDNRVKLDYHFPK
jgi:Cft2 family RNA processing exonuclease